MSLRTARHYQEPKTTELTTDSITDIKASLTPFIKPTFR